MLLQLFQKMVVDSWICLFWIHCIRSEYSCISVCYFRITWPVNFVINLSLLLHRKTTWIANGLGLISYGWWQSRDPNYRKEQVPTNSCFCTRKSKVGYCLFLFMAQKNQFTKLQPLLWTKDKVSTLPQVSFHVKNTNLLSRTPFKFPWKKET